MKTYWNNESGNVAMMTGLALATVMITVGAALDFTSVSGRTNDIQNMADAAVLAAAKSRSDDPAELENIVKTLIDQHNVQGWPLQVNVNVTEDDIAVDISTDYDTMIMGIAGKDTLPVRVVTASPRARLTPINLALVLDTTDSMQGPNITALKTAAAGLVTEMEQMEAKTRLSIVPFGQYVNVGTTQGKPGPRNWIDMGQYGQSYQHCWEPTITVEEPTCTTVGTETYDHIVDGRNMGKRTRDKTECTGGKWEKGPEQCEMRTYDWHGCMGSRDGGHAKKAAVGGKPIPAALDEWCGSTMLPLSDNYNSMRTTISGLTTKGKTYLPSGLVWGWRSLDKNAPYTEATASTDKRLKKAMLFMTDGLNTLSQGNGWSDKDGPKHRREDDGGADGLKLTEDLCKEINKEGIELFVVAYKLPETGQTGAVLEQCATTPSHFFEPESAQELVEDFRQVATMLDYTRLSY